MDLRIDGIDEMRKLADEHPKAAASALNKTMAQVKTQAIRYITRTYRIKRPDVVAKMGDIRKATPKNLRTWFSSAGRRIGFAYFGAKQFAKGVRVRIRKDKPAQTIPGMFIATVRGKGGGGAHTGGFLRHGPLRVARYGRYAGKKRQAIREWTGPSVPQMLSGIVDKLKVFAYEKLPDILQHEIEWRMNRRK